MTGPAWGAVAAFAVFAVLDWISRVRDDRRLEIVAKPLATGALIFLAFVIDSRDSVQQDWFIAALCLSFIGDVLLLDDKRFFVFGLASFLLAHLCYVVGFWLDPPTAVALVIAAGLSIVVLVPLATRIVRAIRASSEPQLATPVTAYVAVIGAMVVSALATGNPAAGAGAVLFAGSDSMIAWNRFVRPFAAASLAIMVTYHLGQLGLVLSLR